MKCAQLQFKLVPKQNANYHLNGSFECTIEGKIKSNVHIEQYVLVVQAKLTC
jgi:hypothetical protein